MNLLLWRTNMKTHNISPILFGNGDELIYVSHLAFKHALGKKLMEGHQEFLVCLPPSTASQCLHFCFEVMLTCLRDVGWKWIGHFWFLSLCLLIYFCRKRPRRVLWRKVLSSKRVFTDCHRRLPQVLLKRWLSLKIVIKDSSKFCWSDGGLERLSSKTAKSSAEEMAVLKDCHQRLPKVLLKRWLSLKIVIKDCPRFCWRDGCL